MKRFNLLIVLFMLLSITLLSCGASHYSVSDHSDCQSATGQPTTCTVSLHNDSSSSGDFNWTASSDPAGASFNPSSGSISPGSDQNNIQVTVPPGICPFTLTFTGDDSTMVQDQISQC
jgi:hypothetical protein